MSGDPAGRDEGPFRRQLMLLVTGLGVIAFIATLLLGAYSPDLRSGKNGGGHALSNAAIGFSGLVRLAEATGRNPRVIRKAFQLGGEELAVITPPNGSAGLSKVLAARGPRSTLIVLPKWRTQRKDFPSGWVSVDGLMPPLVVENMLSPAFEISVRRRTTKRLSLHSASEVVPSGGQFREVSLLQTVAGRKITPLIVDSRGGVVLGKVGNGNLYLLADPDLFNNHGLADQAQAAAALALLDDLNSTGAKGILFDVTTNGFGVSRSPLRLAFDPPFLAVTAVIFAALLLAGWQALVRFGTPTLPTRSIAFGKAALIENSAAIIRKARREVRLGTRYAGLARERAATVFRLPPTLQAQEVDAALDRLRPDQPFSALAKAVADARGRSQLAGAARAMNRWIQEASE